MRVLENYKGFSVCALDKTTAEKYKKEILVLLNLIPNSNYKEEDITAEKKGERILYNKWEHSIIIFKNNMPVGVLISYEREKEDDNLYPENCLYINEIAVSEKYQSFGLGKQMIEYVLKNTKNFITLKGKVVFKVQTEDSSANEKVINFYKHLGFTQKGRKEYPCKYDLVMELKDEI